MILVTGATGNVGGELVRDPQPQPDVRDVTGRAPRTFGQWPQAHAGAFRPS